MILQKKFQMPLSLYNQQLTNAPAVGLLHPVGLGLPRDDGLPQPPGQELPLD